MTFFRDHSPITVPENRERHGQWEPLHKGHAIEQVACAVNFNGELADGDIEKVGALGKKFKDELPGIHELHTVSLAIGNAPSLAKRGAAGYLFQLARPDGTIESEVRCDRNSVNFRTSHYTRWADIWGRAQKYFETFVSVYAQMPIASISLTYVDKFVWEGEIDTAKAKDVLRPNSPYLSPHVYARDDLWHSHTGAFDRPAADIKRLINVNVDYIDQLLPQGPRRLIMVTSALSDLLGQDREVAPLSQPDCIAFVNERMGDLHLLDKEIVEAIVNDEMTQRIAIKSLANV